MRLLVLLGRVIGAVLLVLCGLVAGTLALVVTGRPDRTGGAVAVLAYVGAFQALRLIDLHEAREPSGWSARRQWMFRGTLGYAVVVAAYLLYGLGWPPLDRQATVSMIALVALVLMATGACAVASRYPRLSAGLAGVAAGYAGFAIGKVFGSPGGWWSGLAQGPAATLAFGLAVSAMSAFFSAFIFTRPLWPAWLGGDEAAA